MATRGTIALELEDGTVQQVYCHWDNYLSNNGKILQEHYSDPFKIRELIDLGDLSVLHANIGEKHDFNTNYSEGCTFYGRDRGETSVEARRFKNYEDYLKSAQFEEYNYILRRDGNWYVEYHDASEFRMLTEALAVEAREGEE
jgi:hypothetical protein